MPGSQDIKAPNDQDFVVRLVLWDDKNKTVPVNLDGLAVSWKFFNRKNGSLILTTTSEELTLQLPNAVQLNLDDSRAVLLGQRAYYEFRIHSDDQPGGKVMLRGMWELES